MTAPWLDEVYTLTFKGELDGALDLLFRQVDELLLADQFSTCDALLQAIDVQRLDTHLLIGLLVITLPAASRLQDREALVSRVHDRLSVLAPKRVERLLEGLR